MEIGENINCLYHAHGRVGASGISSVFDLPSKKSSLQKSSAFVFFNLTLQSREARGVPRNQWFSLAHAKENLGKIEPSILCVRDAGIEPATSSMSMKRSTTELIALFGSKNLKDTGGRGRNRTFDLCLIRTAFYH